METGIVPGADHGGSIKRTGKFYNRFYFLYPFVDVFLQKQKKRLFEEVNSCPPGNLLEIGVGNGAHLHLYKTHAITGIDISSAMLDRARNHGFSNIELIEMNGECLSFRDQCFDYIVLSHVIAVATDPEKLLEETYRVLKPGGKIFILNHFTPANWLRYIDRAFATVAGLFHFRSLFHIDSLAAIKKFELFKEIRFGRVSYFKLLIYSRA